MSAPMGEAEEILNDRLVQCSTGALRRIAGGDPRIDPVTLFVSAADRTVLVQRFGSLQLVEKAIRDHAKRLLDDYDGLLTAKGVTAKGEARRCPHGNVLGPGDGCATCRAETGHPNPQWGPPETKPRAEPLASVHVLCVVVALGADPGRAEVTLRIGDREEEASIWVSDDQARKFVIGRTYVLSVEDA